MWICIKGSKYIQENNQYWNLLKTRWNEFCCKTPQTMKFSKNRITKWVNSNILLGWIMTQFLLIDWCQMSLNFVLASPKSSIERLWWIHHTNGVRSVWQQNYSNNNESFWPFSQFQLLQNCWYTISCFYHLPSTYSDW